jgi:hypothetical protein
MRSIPMTMQERGEADTRIRTEIGPTQAQHAPRSGRTLHRDQTNEVRRVREGRAPAVAVQDLHLHDLGLRRLDAAFDVLSEPTEPSTFADWS